MQNIRKQGSFSNVFCGSEGYFQVPLQEIEKLKKSRLRTKNKNRRGATRILSDNLPACSNVRNRHFKFRKFPSEVTCQHPPSRRSFVEMGLFSVFSKTEVNEYIAVRSKARPEDFRNGKSSSRAKFAFYSLFRAITLPPGNAQEAERTIGMHFLREGQERHAPLEESVGRS